MILGVVSVQEIPSGRTPNCWARFGLLTIGTGFNRGLEFARMTLGDTFDARFVGRALDALAGGQSVEEMSIWSIIIRFTARVTSGVTLLSLGSYSSRRPLAARIFFADRLMPIHDLLLASVKG